MQFEIKISEVVERIKQINNFVMDKQVANLLNISYAKLAGWKNRNTYDLDIVLNYAYKNNINIHWLLTGEGVEYTTHFINSEKSIQNIAEPTATYQTDVVKELEKENLKLKAKLEFAQELLQKKLD